MRIERVKDGVTLVFECTTDADHDANPWKDSDGHGPVTEWVSRDKRPGELVLDTGHGTRRFYDYAEACAIALRDGWDTAPYGPRKPRVKAARAAMADFEYLKAWCNDEWRYVCVDVVLLDEDGNETEVQASMGGVEDNGGDLVGEAAAQLVDELMAGYGEDWGPALATTYRLQAAK